MELKHHKSLSPEKWASFPFDRRLLMIANEMNRAGHWLRKKDFTEMRACYERAIELTCLTVSLPLRPNLRRELVRWKEMLGGMYVCIEPHLSSHDALQNTLVSLDSRIYRILHSRPAPSLV